jgi:uncharacterized protein (TIGR03083 family)
MHESSEYPPVYAALRGRVTAVLEGADSAALDAIAPATPAWRVRDVLAHLVGVSADVLAGNIADAASDTWTHAQVVARRDRSVAELLHEWEVCGPQLEALLPAVPPTPVGQLVFDAVTHEHDIRHALGRQGSQDSDAVTMSADWSVAMAPRRSAGRTTAIAVGFPGGEACFGEGDAIATVLMPSAFEFVRCVSGRRSAAQIANYQWAGTADPEALLLAGIFSVSPIDIVE